MTAPTDAALRERVRAAAVHVMGQEAGIGRPRHCYIADKVADAVLAAIPEPPVRRVELDGPYYTTWDGRSYVIQNTAQPTYRDCVGSAASVCVGYVWLNTKRDAKVLELLALRDGEGPHGWANRYDNGGATLFDTRERALSVIGIKRDPIPLYTHPPATPSPTREVIGHAHYGKALAVAWLTDRDRTLAETKECALRYANKGTVVELLRGDVVQS